MFLGSPELNSQIFERITFSAAFSAFGFCYFVFRIITFAGPIFMFLPPDLHHVGTPSISFRVMI